MLETGRVAAMRTVVRIFFLLTVALITAAILRSMI